MTLMTRKEAAARLGMSLPTLDQERSTGRLAYIQRKPGSKVWITDEAIADGLRFYDLEDFNLVICKPDRRVIYSNCQWSRIGESGTLGACVLEKVTVVAGKRLEVSA